MGFVRRSLRPFVVRLRLLMSRAIDGSRLNAEAGQTRVEINHLTTAMRDAHRALGRIEAQVQALAAVVGRAGEGEDGQADGLAGRMDGVAHRADELQRGIYRISANVDRVVAMAEASAAREERLQLGLDALRVGQQSSADIDQARDERLQLGLDALRVGQQSSADIDQARGERLELVADALCRDKQSLVERSEVVLGRTGDLLGLLGVVVSRVDLLAQRLIIPLGPEILMRIPEGLLLVPAEDSALVTAVWESHGRLEPGTLKVVLALLRSGDHVIDVGANIGLVTLPAARAVGSKGHVVAVEPSARIADLLDRTLFLNFGSGRVTLHRVAAGEEPGTASLNIGFTTGHSSLLPLPGSGRTEQVEVAALDDLIEPGRRIRLIKIDAEGYEPSVWRGMGRILSENPEIVVVVEFGPEHLRRAKVTLDEWLDPFLSPGFTAHEIDEQSGVLRPLRARHDLHRVASLNLLLLKLPPSSYPMLEFA